MSNRDQAFRALNHFGFGARPGEVERWQTVSAPQMLANQISASAVALRGPELSELAREYSQRNQPVLEARRSGDEAGGMEARRRLRRWERQQFAQAQGASLNARLGGNAFAERLVAFWSNHFTISANGKPEIMAFAGHFERHAIRPYVFGKFRDMLRATATHPAMMLYLDQTRSVGPNSTIGTRRDIGLNENYARELVELHTLGVNGGYSEEDVRALARALTGFTLGPDLAREQRINRILERFGYQTLPGAPGFAFVDAIHEPGEKRVLNWAVGGRGQPQGMDEALSLIDALASHPSTALFVATKFARHFVSDIPTGDVIEFLATRFQQTDGDLAQVSLALLELPQAWDPQNRKFKTPQDFVVSIARALGVTDLSQQGVEALELTGQLPWLAGSPAGYADRAGPWSGADALIKRAEISQEITNQLSAQFLTNVGSPFALAAETLPLSAQSPLGQALSQSQDARTGLALLFASPDFQWR